MSSIPQLPETISPEKVRSELLRLQQSIQLRNSTQLRKLLHYLVEEQLAGRGDELKEYNVGISVFQRGTDFDPRLDSIVRVQASILRKKLEQFYAAEGAASEIAIALPRGSYAPVWQRTKSSLSLSLADTTAITNTTALANNTALANTTALAKATATPVAASPEISEAPLSADNSRPGANAISTPNPSTTHSGLRRLLTIGAALAAGAALGGAAAWRFLPAGLPAPNRQGQPASSLWATFLQPGVPTIVSFGVPLFYAGSGGIYLRDVEVNRPEEIARGRLRTIANGAGLQIRPQEDVYTGIGEAVGVQLVSRFLEQHGVSTTVANSHYLGPPDLVGKNLVIVSSMRFQTLLDSLRLPHAFPFDPAQEGILRNSRPLPNEPEQYVSKAEGNLAVSYARITIWPSASADRRILFLSGRETWATQAAAQFVVEASRQAELQAKLSADPDEGPRGKKGPFFEALLRVEGQNNRALRTQYITHRYLEVALPLRFR